MIIFTASEQEYADPIIDYLDPTGSLIAARFYRQHCVYIPEPGMFVKDLRIFSEHRDLSDLVLVDNSVYSFAFQLENGVPIVSFYDEKDDDEMTHLMYYLELLADCDDVREQNREAFQLKELA